MNEVRQSLGEIPIVEDELRKAAGEEQLEDESVSNVSTAAPVQKLVTADGTYATQSAFSSAGGSGGGAGDKKAQAAKVKYERNKRHSY